MRGTAVMKLAAVSIAVVLASTGCVSKQSYELAQTQLEECRADKKAAQDAAAACEERFQREVAQWDDAEKALTEVVPQSLVQLQEERDKILELVPDAARQEVRAYFDDFSKSVSRGFQSLQANQESLRADNARILAELDTARLSLAAVGDRTQSIDTTLKGNLQSANQDRQRMRAAAASIAQMVQEFDQSYINEKGSGDRLSLSRKERETIINFHARVAAALAALQADEPASVPAAAEPAAPAAETEAEAEG